MCYKDGKEYYRLLAGQKYVPLFAKHIVPWVEIGKNYIGLCLLLAYFPGEDKYFAKLPTEKNQYFVKQVKARPA